MERETNKGHELMARHVIAQLEDGTLPAVTRAAEAQGYAINQSHKIRKAKTFQQVLFYEAPFDFLAKIQKKQLVACNHHTYHWPQLPMEDEQKILDICAANDWKVLHTYRKGDEFVTIVTVPNWDHIDRALDKFYKIMGAYAPERVEHGLSRPLEDMTDEELAKYVNEATGKHIMQPDDLSVSSDEVAPENPSLPQADAPKDVIDASV